MFRSTLNPTNDSHVTTSDLDKLANHLARTDINHERGEEWHYFPPGTTLDEQLLILAGVEDYKISGKEGETFSQQELEKARNEIEAALKEEEVHESAKVKTVQDTMSAHLAHLEENDLVTRFSTSLNINDNKPRRRFRDSPYLAALKKQYADALQTSTTPHTFAHAPLPRDTTEWEELSFFMAEQTALWCAKGNVVVFSPLKHPFHPLWVPSQRDAHMYSAAPRSPHGQGL